MSSAAARTASPKRTPYFRTYTEVEVDIDPSELEREGWVYVGKEDEQPTTERVIETVRRWHDDYHEGPWVWCGHELCDQLRGRSAL